MTACVALGAVENMYVVFDDVFIQMRLQVFIAPPRPHLMLETYYSAAMESAARDCAAIKVTSSQVHLMLMRYKLESIVSCERFICCVNMDVLIFFTFNGEQHIYIP